MDKLRRSDTFLTEEDFINPSRFHSLAKGTSELAVKTEFSLTKYWSKTQTSPEEPVEVEDLAIILGGLELSGLMTNAALKRIAGEILADMESQALHDKEAADDQRFESQRDNKLSGSEKFYDR